MKTLRRNAERVEALPAWVRSAVSVDRVFHIKKGATLPHMVDKSPTEYRAIIEHCLRELREHDAEYDHRTSKRLYERIAEALGN